MLIICNQTNYFLPQARPTPGNQRINTLMFAYIISQQQDFDINPSIIHSAVLQQNSGPDYK